MKMQGVICQLKSLLLVMGITVHLYLLAPFLASLLFTLPSVNCASSRVNSGYHINSLNVSTHRDKSSNSSVQSSSMHNEMLKITLQDDTIASSNQSINNDVNGTKSLFDMQSVTSQMKHIIVPFDVTFDSGTIHAKEIASKDEVARQMKHVTPSEISEVTGGRVNRRRRRRRRRRSNVEDESKKKYPVSYFLLDASKFPASIKQAVSIVGEEGRGVRGVSRVSRSSSRERRDDEGQSSYTASESNYYTTRSTLPSNHMNIPASLSLSTSSGSGCPPWSPSNDQSAGHSVTQRHKSVSDTHSDTSRLNDQSADDRVAVHGDTPSVNCSCYDFDDGLFIECPNTNVNTIKSSLESIRVHNLRNHLAVSSVSDTSNAPAVTIKSFTIYNIDSNVHKLPGKLFAAVKQMKKIRISDTSLTSISDDSFEGIESQLESLSISSSKLTIVPQKALSTLRLLDTLDLDSNEITEINAYSFYGLPLISLNLQSNRIHYLQEYSFGGLENSLQELTLIDNLLTIFPLSALRRLKNLRTLKLNENKISTIASDEYTRFPYMSNLDLRSNIIHHLQDSSFITMPNLISLSLSSNKISTIDDKVFSHLLNLESLDLSKNYLRLLNGVIFSSLSKLRSIDLTNNHIHYIEMGTFHNLPQLRELFLTKNNLRSLLNGTFYNTTQIRSLFIEHNSLESIDSGVFSSLNHLYQLHLSYNQLTRISINLFKFNQELRSLSLDNNWLQTLTPGTFDNLIELRDLRLHKNNIDRVSRSHFQLIPNLQELHLQNNNIQVIEEESFASLTNLEYLDIQGNVFKVFTQSILSKFASNLKYLHLNYNQITRVNDKSFEGQSQLEVIWLNNNNLTRITSNLFANLTSMEKLFLDNNQINRIDKGSFAACKNLRQLNLRFNQLEYIDGLTFSGLSSLESLDVSFNPIKTFDSSVFTPMSSSIRKINLHNCQLRDVRRDWFFNSNWIENSLEDAAYRNLETLIMSKCRVEKIEPFSIASLDNLRNLALDDNLLEASSLLQTLREGAQLIKKNVSRRLKGVPSPVDTPDNDIDDVHSTEHCVNSREQFNMLPSSINSIFPNGIENLSLSGNNLSGLDLSDPRTSSPESDHLLDDPSHHHSNIFHHLHSLNKLDLSYTSIESASYFASPISSSGDLSSVKLGKRRCPPLNNTSDAIEEDNSSSHSTSSWKNVRVIKLSGNGIKFIASSAITHHPGNNLHSSDGRSSKLPQTSHLTELYLDDNQLTSVPSSDVLKYHKHLHHLSLSGNNIKRIPGGSFKFNNKLTSIDLSNNSLSVMDIASFEGLNVSLESLNLSHNVMRSIPTGILDSLTALTTLIFDSNWFPFIPNSLIRSTRLPSLRTVSFKSNPLTRIREDTSDTFEGSMENVTTLTLEGGNLTVISSHDLTPFLRLKELNLHSNQILKISPGAFRKLTSLQSLDLSHNRLELLPEERLSSISNLRHLNLSKNHLSELPSFSPDLKVISVIDVSSNRLTRIDTFGHLSSSIEEMYLQDNMIAWISGSSLSNLTSLRKLDLRSNFLTHIPESLLTPIEVSLEILYLTGNPFHCDCRLLSLWEWVQEHSRVLPQKDREVDLICVQSDDVDDTSSSDVSSSTVSVPLRQRLSTVSLNSGKRVNQIVLSTLHPVDFCPVPLISRVEVIKIESTSLTLQWYVQNDSLVGAFRLDQYMSNDHRNSKTLRLTSTERTTTLSNLHPETEYTICIEANGKYIRPSDAPDSTSVSDTRHASYVFGLHRTYGDNYITSNRKCVQSRTHTEVGNKQMIIFFNRISLTGLIVGASGVIFTIAIVIVSASLLVKWKDLRQSRRVKQQSTHQQQQQQQDECEELQHHDLLHSSQSIHSQLHQMTSTVATTTILPEAVTMTPDDYLIDQIDSMPLPLPIQTQIPEEFITYRHFALPTHDCIYNNAWTSGHTGPCEHVTQID